ncbi:MAG: hypothetical protein P4L83_21600 [Nevskia sp.]|nr:hypothetical protein [Nevskia sp.]
MNSEARASAPRMFYYRYSWIIVVFAVAYAYLATQAKESPSVVTNVIVGLFLAAIYIEWKTLRVSLDENSIQSRSLFHGRELRYSDIKSAGIVFVPKGGRSLRIVGRTGTVFKIDSSLSQFDTFAALVKKLVEDNGGVFEEPRWWGRRA